MATLSPAERQALWAEFMRRLSRERQQVGALTKVDLRAAVDAIDDWIDANAGSVNAAIPLPARSALTAKQKALLFFSVADRRFGVL